MTTTTQGQAPAATRESNALVKAAQGREAIEITDDRVIVSLSMPRSDGQWEEYPHNYSVWKRATPALYEQAKRLQEGHVLWVTWTEKPAQRGVYRDVVEMGKPRGETPPSVTPADTRSAPAPAPAAIPADARSEAPAPSQPPVRGNGQPGLREAGPGTWRESYAQSREGQALERASIEAQKAVALATEMMRDFLVTTNWDVPEKVAFVGKHLTTLTMMAVRALNEARPALRGQ